MPPGDMSRHVSGRPSPTGEAAALNGVRGDIIRFCPYNHIILHWCNSPGRARVHCTPGAMPHVSDYLRDRTACRVCPVDGLSPPRWLPCFAGPEGISQASGRSEPRHSLGKTSSYRLRRLPGHPPSVTMISAQQYNAPTVFPTDLTKVSVTRIIYRSSSYGGSRRETHSLCVPSD